MSSNERITSIPSGIRAVCVVDGYFILVGMAFAMIGLADIEGSTWLDFSLIGVKGLSWAILTMLILVLAQLYVVQGIWNIKSWAWPAALSMLGFQALILTGLVAWVLLGEDMPISYADGLLRWIVPLLFVVGAGLYLFDQREWFTEV